MSSNNQEQRAAFRRRLRNGVSIGALVVLIGSVTITCMDSAPAGADVRAPMDTVSSPPDDLHAYTAGAPPLAPAATGKPATPAPATRTQAKRSLSPPCRQGQPKGPTILGGKLNLNTANEAQLMLLPGIGPSKARRILRWRSRHKRFRRTRDLRRVKGFGYKTFKRLRRYLRVDGPTSLARQPLAPQ